MREFFHVQIQFDVEIEGGNVPIRIIEVLFESSFLHS